MRHDDPSLAALIGSRICHDLISPIGAISNGLELFGLAGAAPDGPEMSLIQQSCDNATAQIRFFRIAFGSAGDSRPVPATEARKTLADHYAATRIATDWHVTADLGRDVTQLAYLSVLCLESALPKGGLLSVALDGSALVSTAEADIVRTDTSLWTDLTNGCTGGPKHLLPTDVQFALLARLCEDHGITPVLGTQAGLAQLTLALPGKDS